MFFFFLKKDVYIGYSLNELSKIRGILFQEGIKYTYKVRSLLDRGSRRGIRGSYGINMAYEKQYTVFVNKKDFAKASYLVNKVLHS